MDLKQFKAGSCYSYGLSSNGEAVIVDPHISLLNEYESYLKKHKLKLSAIVDTHTHADHFSLAAVLKKRTGAPVIMHEKAISQVADKRVKEGDVIMAGEAALKVVYSPGHTDDAISLHGDGKLFTGDVLLIGSVGRTDFQNGSPESMFETLQKLRALPDEVELFPGHDYHGKSSSTLGIEKKTNPFLKESDREAFLNYARSKRLPKPFNLDNIVRVNQKGEAASLEMIGPREASRLIEKDAEAQLLDVRSAMEFTETHIKGSVNIPIDMLSGKLEELGGSKKRYIVLCRTGNRSPMAADMMIQAGIQNVKVLDGGLTSWQKERLPVEKGAGGMSLERQVRIIAGTLVLSGILLAWFAHPGFIGISLFVSCGLIFAGITDNCLLGMLLMKLPYNKKLYRPKLGGGTCSIS